MPPCIVLDSYKIKQRTNGLRIELLLPAAATETLNKFASVMEAAFPGCTARVAGPPTLDLGSFKLVGRLEVMTTTDIMHEVNSVLSLMVNHLTIFDSLDSSHALAPHKLFVGLDDASQRTYVGELVYRAKYQGDQNACDELGRLLAEFVGRHPSYSNAHVLCAVPSSEPSKAFHLPMHLAQDLAGRLGKSLVQADRVRQTEAQKNLEDETEKRSNVQGSMAIKGSLQGRSVILLDDLYESGSSMGELARACREAGAGRVLGLAASKTRRFLQVLNVEEYADRWIAKSG